MIISLSLNDSILIDHLSTVAKGKLGANFQTIECSNDGERSQITYIVIYDLSNVFIQIVFRMYRRDSSRQHDHHSYRKRAEFRRSSADVLKGKTIHFFEIVK